MEKKLKPEEKLWKTLELFNHPLFPLLADRPISRRQLNALLRKFRKKESDGWVWDFPGNRSRSSLDDDDSGLLRRQGDLWGLFAIVLLAREAEANHDVAAHVRHCKEMYRSVPQLLAQPWICPFEQLLKRCLDTVWSRMPLSTAMFDVDWSILVSPSALANYPGNPEPIIENEIVSRKELSDLAQLVEGHVQNSANYYSPIEDDD